MNAIELLDYIFGGVEGEFAVFGIFGEKLLSPSNLPQELPEYTDAVELMIVGEKAVVGFPIEDLSKATFKLRRGDAVVGYALLETPVFCDLIPEEVLTFDMDVTGDWVFELGTDQFYTFEELFPAWVDVTETDTEQEDATDHLEDAAEDAELVGEEDASADEGARVLDAEEGEGAEDVSGPDQSEHADVPRDPDGRGAAGSGSEGAGEVAGAGGEGAEEAEPAFLNDAEIRGKEVEGLAEFLDRPATFLTGELWGLKDRRNTQDGDWKAVTTTWGNWIGGAPGNKNTPAVGFSRHPEGKYKEGPSLVLGSSIGGARKAQAMVEMFAMGLDVDSGAQLDDVLETIEKAGLLCFVYTSFNNGKRGIELKRDEVLRKLQIKRDPSMEEVRQYLREFSKSRYEEDFIARCEIEDQKRQTSSGVKIVLRTPPLEKFRLIFPLAEPVKLIDLAPTHEASLEMWEAKITGLARNMLGVHFDVSCTDPSRLFYTARHPKGDDGWYCAILQGRPLSFEEVPAMKKTAYTAVRDANPFAMAGGADADDRPPMALTPSGKSLNEWHTRFKERFQLADLMETLCPDKVRYAGGEASGHVHTECPFEHEHSKEGGTACMAVNALDSQNSYWTWFCHHDSCQGRHKLQFLEEALRSGWFEESALWDMDQGFVLEAADGEEEEVEEEVVLEGDTYVSPEDQAAALDNPSTEDIEKFIKKMLRLNLGEVEQSRVIDALSKSAKLGKREIKSIWGRMADAKRKRERDREEAEEEAGVAVVNQWDFDKLVEYANRRIFDENKTTPRVFHYMESLYVIRENAEGHARMRQLDRDGFAHHLNNVARFVRVTGEEKSEIAVSAPKDVVSHLFAADYGTYPSLRGLVTTPAFMRDGSLLTTPGYDWSNNIYYKPDITLSVPRVSAAPTEEEVFRAKQLLIEEAFADFPLGALTRTEIVEQALHGDGVPAVTNLIAMVLLPFMRELIDGPTPGHLLTKPAPGTGASLITDVFSIIATGQVTPAMAMPGGKDEMSKTLTSVLSNGQNIVFFDNINHSVDSGELASAMTTPTYQARILGKSQTVEVDVRCVWVFTGNNVTLSSELVRRLIMIDLDARLENPEMRTGFRHRDIRGWVREHRGELVWACLTLIQNWIAKGKVKQKDVVLASYENWSGIVGGVLRDAGLGGFMGNRETLKATASDSETDDLILLLEAWWDAAGTRPIYTKGSEKKDGLIDLAVAADLSLPVRKEVNSDGDRVFSNQGFTAFLSKFKNRVFSLEDGTQVTIQKEHKRQKNGNVWYLVPVAAPPKSNIE